MPANPFQKATKKRSKLRLGLIGPPGTGKTYTALAIASGLGKKIAVIDSEHGSASLYADIFQFDALNLEECSPQNYIQLIGAAEQHGYDVVVIDSLSHAWMGKGGALEQVDNAAKRSQSGNTFNAWRDVTPWHNRLVEAMVASPLHVIATLRSKMEYVVEDNGRGKQVPRKIGLAPIQREGLEYEFTLAGEINLNHELMISKTRCPLFTDAIIPKPGAEFAAQLLGWLESGEEVADPRDAAREAAVRWFSGIVTTLRARWAKTKGETPGLADDPNEEGLPFPLLDFAGGLHWRAKDIRLTEVEVDEGSEPWAYVRALWPAFKESDEVPEALVKAAWGLVKDKVAVLKDKATQSGPPSV